MTVVPRFRTSRPQASKTAVGFGDDVPSIAGLVTARRSWGSGSLIVATRADGTRVYYAKFRDGAGRQVKRRSGLVRTPHTPDGLTKVQAEARLRDAMNSVEATTPVEHAR